MEKLFNEDKKLKPKPKLERIMEVILSRAEDNLPIDILWEEFEMDDFALEFITKVAPVIYRQRKVNRVICFWRRINWGAWKFWSSKCKLKQELGVISNLLHQAHTLPEVALELPVQARAAHWDDQEELMCLFEETMYYLAEFPGSWRKVSRHLSSVIKDLEA